jgi:hypothetical protein
MRKLPQVQDAKELMTEAMDWSTFRWLFEKARVRQTADRANDALDRLDRAVKARWSDETKAAYKKLCAKPQRTERLQQKDPQPPQSSNPHIDAFIAKVVEADDAAERARIDAEETFEQAEENMSVSLAREGCKKAIRSWELHEKAIRRAEAVPA